MAIESLWRGVAGEGSGFKGHESQEPLEKKNGEGSRCRRMGLKGRIRFGEVLTERFTQVLILGEGFNVF